MSYFDNVDWEELERQAIRKTLEKCIELRMEGKEVDGLVRKMYRDFYDEIWLMGPVPMKKGYKPPTFESSLFE
jgi:hypothetical protein